MIEIRLKVNSQHLMKSGSVKTTGRPHVGSRKTTDVMVQCRANAGPVSQTVGKNFKTTLNKILCLFGNGP